tara:strand:- start:6605 stop:6814 length:210 start_codon:yes stop_codon:yes gene_type:complete
MKPFLILLTIALFSCQADTFFPAPLAAKEASELSKGADLQKLVHEDMIASHEFLKRACRRSSRRPRRKW